VNSVINFFIRCWHVYGAHTRWPGVISRGNAWERRSHCWKAAGTHGNGVPIVKMCKNAQNSSQVEKKNKNGLRVLPYAKTRVVVQLTLTKIIKIVANRWRILWLKCIKFDFGWGSAPDHAGELTAPPDHLAVFGAYF